MTTIRIKLPPGGAAAASNVDVDVSSSDESDSDSEGRKSLHDQEDLDDDIAEPVDKRDALDADYEEPQNRSRSSTQFRSSAGSGTVGRVVISDDDDDDDDDAESSDKYIEASQAASAAMSSSVSRSSVPERYQNIVHDLTEQELRLLDKYVHSKKLVPKFSARMEQVAAARRAQEMEENKRRGGVFGDRDPRAGVVKRPRINATLPENSQVLQSPQSAITPASASHALAQGQMDRGKSISMLSSNYDDAGVLMLSDWRSTESKEPLVIKLPELEHEAPSNTPRITNVSGQGPQQGNTVVIWGTFPDASERFSINIAPSASYKERDEKTIFLYHFNPRDGWGKKQIQQNAFVGGKWVDRAKQSSMPITKNKRFELRITITQRDFLVFLDGKHFDTFGNRADPRYLKNGESLYLIVPLVEDHYGDKEDVIIHGVWWGHRPAQVRTPSGGSSSALSPQKKFHHMNGMRPHASSFGSGYGGHHGGGARGGHTGGHRRPRASQQLEEKVLFVSGLPKESTSAFNECLRHFEQFGIERDHNGQPRIRVMEGRDFGFVTLQDESKIQEAIKFLHGKPGQPGLILSVSRARKRPNSHHS